MALGGDGVGPSASRTFLNILTRVSVNQLHFRTFPKLFSPRQRTVPCPADGIQKAAENDLHPLGKGTVLRSELRGKGSRIKLEN